MEFTLDVNRCLTNDTTGGCIPTIRLVGGKELFDYDPLKTTTATLNSGFMKRETENVMGKHIVV